MQAQLIFGWFLTKNSRKNCKQVFFRKNSFFWKIKKQYADEKLSVQRIFHAYLEAEFGVFREKGVLSCPHGLFEDNKIRMAKVSAIHMA